MSSSTTREGARIGALTTAVAAWVLALGLACTGDTATDTTDAVDAATDATPEPEPEEPDPDRGGGRHGKGRKGGGREDDDEGGGGGRRAGGCRATKTSASSALGGHDASLVSDGDAHTSWCENETGFGTGERVTLTLDGKCSPSKLTILPGDFTNQASLKQNSRIERIMVTDNHGKEVVFNIPDVADEPFEKALGTPKTFDIPASFGTPDEIMVRIDAVYPGPRGAAACISTLELD